MAFKETHPDFQMIDITRIEPDPAHPRKHFDEASLQGLAHSIRHQGLIQPLIVQPADANGRYRLIVGERRWRAAQLAGETQVPALIRPCGAEEALEIRVFENLGLGLRAPLETREMANAIQAISHRFENRDQAAEHFGRPAAWLNQVTAAANLSPRITALLDDGQLTSAATAVQLDKLARKNEARAESLIGQIKVGEKVPKKVVDRALAEESGRLRPPVPEHKAGDEEPASAPQGAAQPAPGDSLAAPGPSETVASSTAALTDLPSDGATEAPAAAPLPTAGVPSSFPHAPSSGQRINPVKVREVARILGVNEGDEEAVLARLIDEFLALKGGS